MNESETDRKWIKMDFTLPCKMDSFAWILTKDERCDYIWWW